MTDSEKFVSILHSSGTEYFAYSDSNSIGSLENIIVVFVDGIAIFHKFITDDEEYKTKSQRYTGCSVEKVWNSLDEIVKEVSG